MDKPIFATIGRRKKARARVRLSHGSGKIIVNGKEPVDYFKTEDFTNSALLPLKTVEMSDQVDVIVKAEGGGLHGQAGATSLGIARALEKLNEELYCHDEETRETPHPKLRAVCRDPDDIKILGLAVASNADYIVTGDKDLLVLKSFQGILILNPRSFSGILHSGEK